MNWFTGQGFFIGSIQSPCMWWDEEEERLNGLLGTIQYNSQDATVKSPIL